MLEPLSRQLLVSTFISSRVDFCNTMLAGIPACTSSARIKRRSAVRRCRRTSTSQTLFGRYTGYQSLTGFVTSSVLWCTLSTTALVHPKSRTHVTLCRHRGHGSCRRWITESAPFTSCWEKRRETWRVDCSLISKSPVGTTVWREGMTYFVSMVISSSEISINIRSHYPGCHLCRS